MGYELAEVKKIFSDYTERMEKSVESMKIEFQNIRAGRANPHILDKITVEAYGVPTPLNQIGNITVPEARVLIVSVWDTSLLKAAEKAILAANIGITPTNDGKILRLVFPEVTGERRKELVKTVKTAGETAKVALRNERRDVLEGLKKLKKDNLITEDDQKTFEKDADKLIAQKNELVDRLIKEKEEEILSV
ncbi:MAG: ribosome recycling factor [Clostridiales bacterium]|jgi:ribosome recycling factor|nr:ribosome recycling factor [Clostridiales bacterium]